MHRIERAPSRARSSLLHPSIYSVSIRWAILANREGRSGQCQGVAENFCGFPVDCGGTLLVS
jgi:hypothetical protein